MEKVARVIVNHPKLVLLIAMLLIIPSAIGYFNTFVNYDILSYLPSSLESVKGEGELDTVFHNAASSFIIFHNMPEKKISAIRSQILDVDGVTNAFSLDSVFNETVPKEILPDLINSVAYSKDGEYQLMLVQYDSAAASTRTYNAVESVNKIVRGKCYVSGLSAILADTKDLVDEEAPTYIVIAIVLALIVLSFTMRSWLTPFILLWALGLAVIYNMGTNIFFGQISYITQCMAAILQLGVTMDYSVFLMDRFEEEKRRHANKKDAMVVAIKESFVALAGSSLTTIFGFLALCFMELSLGRDIGFVMAKGVLLGIVTVILVLPAMLLIFDNAIIRQAHRSVAPSFHALNRFTTKHHKVFTVIFLLMFIPAYYLNSQVQVYYDISRSMPQDMASLVAYSMMKDKFDMSSTHFLIVNDDMEAKQLIAMEDDLGKVDGVTGVLAYNKFVGPSLPDDILPDSVLSIIKNDGLQIIMINSEYAVATDNVNTQVENIYNIAKSYDSTAILTGEPAMTKDLITVASRDFKITNIISIAAIFILVGICFYSISIPVLLVSSIELAIFINVAVSTLKGDVIPFIAPTIVGCVQLGATVDYAILLTTRFREELRNGYDKLTAIRIAADSSDRSIFQSSMVFFGATFGVYMLCDIEIVKSLCAMLARGSIISALVIELLLSPVLLTCEKLIHKTSYNWMGDIPKKVKKKKHGGSSAENTVEVN